MNMNRLMAAKAAMIAVGVILAVCSMTGLVEEFWGTLGITWVLVGVIQLVRVFRYKTDSDYRSRVTVEKDDERNKYISMKAWSWAGYMYIVAAGVAAIMLKIAGQEELMKAAGFSVMLLVLLYWASWMYLRKKY